MSAQVQELATTASQRRGLVAQFKLERSEPTRIQARASRLAA
jgi:hypothetical protein